MHVDAVFRTFQLGLELQEVLVGFQVGIVFGNGEQLAESGSNRALCFLVFGQLFRCQVVGIYGHLGGLATGFYHTFQRFLFVRGISFDCVYEIRYQSHDVDIVFLR